MQIQKMYSIYDQAAGAYLTPFFMANDLLAIRTFAALVNQQDHLFSTSPQDFTLFCFGSFNVTTGDMEPEKIRAVRTATALIQREPSDSQIELALGVAADNTSNPTPVENVTKGDGSYTDFVKERNNNA